MSSKIVLTYGIYDLFHVGYLRLLKRFKALGDKLIVGVSSDIKKHNVDIKDYCDVVYLPRTTQTF